MTNIKERSGAVILLALSLFPVYLWLLLLPLADRFGSLVQFLHSLGQLAGLVGLAMFALNLVLGARLKFLENYFGGLDRVYRTHHFYGGLAFILLMVHPLFLMMNFLPVSIRAAALFLLPGRDPIVDLGIYALLLMTVLLVLTFFYRLKYQIWKFSHKFLGLAFFLGGLHAFFIPSDISRSLPLRVYMLSLISLGLTALVYRTILGWLLIKRSEYQVAAVRTLPGNITEIELKPLKKSLKYRAGQFIFIGFPGSKLGREVHPFSITSISGEKHLRIIAKSLGDYTRRLPELRAGARALVEGPFGRFHYKSARHRDQIWVAGGVGITPFFAMAQELAAQQDTKHRIDLYYSLRSQEEAMLLDRLKALANGRINLRVHEFYSDKQGWINAGYIRAKSQGLENKDIFLCGPSGMTRDLRRQFLSLKLLPRQIHSEEFNFFQN